MKDNSRKRHILKTFTWRVIGTLDTIILSWLISGSPLFGIQIGFIEVVTKMILYYFHERFWFNSTIKNANKRHIYKTITWRIVGTLDTMLIAWIITGNPVTGLKIGAVEVVTKMALYYLHEKIWYRANYGLSERDNKF
ncbi:DUF2061 domain-containing protein [Winogradskyella ursingii]|uniref:DUF2061 domain-containing protein n=1 Tax=Winogradskyella ursingii TaxID=2686079 RepID=UPI0015CA639E|nr:DUF2061 domain-containing protein [Winogradskyella ursingii]